MTQIRGFYGDYRFLSNFYDCKLIVDGISYPTLEHYYQAMKATDLEDHDYVALAPTPGLAKHRGKRIKIRDDWDKVKLAKMRIGLRAKFDQNTDLKEMLLETGHADLVEDNAWHDTFWGVCNGKGFNHLGEMLMELRDSYRMDALFDD